MVVEIAEQIDSIEEYFEFCRTHEGRFEYVDGEIIEIDMAGESTMANEIASNMNLFFRVLLKGKPFKVYQGLVKLLIQKGKKYRLPDVVVVRQEGVQKDSVTQAVLLVEVLSDSTQEIDHTKKLHEYTSLLSVQYYLLVSQDEPLVELYRRDGSEWKFEYYTRLEDTIQLPFLETAITLNKIYEGVIF